MMGELPPGTPDWIRTHCLGIRLLRAPYIARDGEPMDVAIKLRDQTDFLKGNAHGAAGDLYMNLLHLHSRGTPFTVPLNHYVQREELLASLLSMGFEAELVTIGWAYGFDLRSNHPALESKSACFTCSKVLEEGDRVVTLPGPGHEWHLYHARCMVDILGLDGGSR